MSVTDRIPLHQGYLLQSGTRTYQIEQYISAGSNAMVYQASYRDTLMPEHTHTVLIKELYPLEPSGLIHRDDSMGLVISEEARAFFEYHKESFLLGNQAHLAISEDGGGHLAENLDSFEANHTFYTVLSSRKGCVLSGFLNGGPAFSSLTDTVRVLESLLRALQPFHSHQLLHLDISPDNIFVLDPDASEQTATDVLLLDFNSVYSLNRQLLPVGDYYQGKPAYTAPEVTLHQEKALGPWTDLYSVAAVFYEILTGNPLPEDRELLNTSQFVSPFEGLLLHEKEYSAALTNTILCKGLQILPEKRYQSVPEMRRDVEKLLGVLSGAITDYPPLMAPPAKKKIPIMKKLAVTAAALILLAGGTAAYLLGSPSSPLRQPSEDAVLDLTQIPLERDDSVVLTQINARNPLQENILNLDVGVSTSVRVTLRDFTHSRDPDEVFESYNIFTFFNGKGDKRGWQFNDQIYDFFFSPDNSAHIELPLTDTNPFDLEYVGFAFFDFNYDGASVLLDIKEYTLTDGQGNRYELTDLEGSHIFYFDEETDTWYLTTTQNTEFVTSFQEIYGGRIEAVAELNLLDPLLEVVWESDSPEIATVDQKGAITAVSQGQAKITVTITDKNTGDTRQTQMLVNVTLPY